ncbi:hypothetical protein [Sphingomonas sp. GC_Shp_3]|uniref:hypothetical protein n=1 Tax=Sphingomonas sp. GC_Shp_3 TaxID=2937383 RepID=UPI00226A71B8|nr:hypothetical protein [Sphingomonas sp. GC_Shp_3]
MRIVAGDLTAELGDVETAPTVGIVDYSRRVTDDFGVTTVVQRGFSRTLSVRLGLPFDTVDLVQQTLATVRATPARWIADDRFAWLSPTGFFKDFDIDLSVPPLSYCTLTVEGFAETETLADPGGDPALDGSVSTLRLLQPAEVTDAVLVNSSVAETDAPEWAAATVYPLGARIMKAASHRLYESLVAGNTGNDPTAAATTQWLDVGPTSRWAMFDQALGTTTDANGSIVVTLAAGAVTAVALLDTIGATARVQAPGYDVTTAIGAGATTFLDLPGGNGQVTVTITGDGAVSCGTLLIGQVVDLGVTEASPGAGITDYSRKDIDDFGAVTIVQRAWAKRMTAKALIRTDAVDLVANRIASVRAQPSLWIGQAGVDSLTVYGFFKDFSIEVSETTSKLSLSIEGLSTAAKIAPLATSVSWPDVTDPTGTKPDDNADVTGNNTSKDTHAVGGRPADDLLSTLDKSSTDALFASIFTTNKGAELDALKNLQDGSALTVQINDLVETVSGPDANGKQSLSVLGATQPDGKGGLIFVVSRSTALGTPDQVIGQILDQIIGQVGGHEQTLTFLREVVTGQDGSAVLRGVFELNEDGVTTGIYNTLTNARSDLVFQTDQLRITSKDGSGKVYDWLDISDGIVKIPEAEIAVIRPGTRGTTGVPTIITNLNRYGGKGGSVNDELLSGTVTLYGPGTVDVAAVCNFDRNGANPWSIWVEIDGVAGPPANGIGSKQDTVPLLWARFMPNPGTYTVRVVGNIDSADTVDNRTMRAFALHGVS